MAQSVEREVIYRLKVADDGDIAASFNKAAKAANSAAEAAGKAKKAFEDALRGGGGGASGGGGGGRPGVGAEAEARAQQKIANDTYRLRMKLWADEKREREKGAADAKRDAEETARFEQRVANDTFRLRQRLRREQQREQEQAARDTARAVAQAERSELALYRGLGRSGASDFGSVAADEARFLSDRASQVAAESARAANEREAAARQVERLSESVVDRQLNVAQKGLAAISQLGRAVALTFAAENKELEGMVRSLANFEAIIQGAGGILDAIETGAQLWKLWRTEAELAAAAAKTIGAASTASNVAGLASSASSVAAGGGASWMSGLGGSGFALGAAALPVAGIAAILGSLQMPKDRSEELRREEGQRRANRYAGRDQMSSARLAYADAIGPSADAMYEAKSSMARLRMEAVPEWVRRGMRPEDMAPERLMRGGRASLFNPDGMMDVNAGFRREYQNRRDNLTSDDWERAKSGAKQVLDLEIERQSRAMQGIRDEMTARENAVDSYRNALEAAQGALRGAEHALAGLDPESAMTMRNTHEAIQRGEAANVPYAKLADYDRIAGTSFADEAAKKRVKEMGLDPILANLDRNVKREKVNYDTVFADMAEGRGPQAERTIRIDADTEIKVKMSLEEADVVDAFKPVIEEAMERVRKMLEASAAQASREMQTKTAFNSSAKDLAMIQAGV